MLFRYKVTTDQNKQDHGTIEAANVDNAIAALHRRGFIVLDIESAEKKSLLNITLFEHVSQKDLVVLSRQLSTLFEAKVPVLESFRLVARESESPLLGRTLNNITDDIRSGLPISRALGKYPNVFSNFYTNMVSSAEESGKLSETFSYLAAYLERQYELASRAKHALVYPAFIIFAFVAVMVLMFTVVIPKLSQVILETGTEIPLYTKIVIGISNFFVEFGVLVAILIILAVLLLWRYSITEKGKAAIDGFKLNIPYVGDLYRKLYLSRIADNLDTMLTSGISILKAIEVTSRVVGSITYKNILDESAERIRGGGTLSDAISEYKEVPRIMVQMMRIGEETGRLGFVLGTVARFYRREVENSIETIVSLIEPIMIILLGVGVGILLTSVLLPIYNLAGSI
jgi:type IV pilus assembly protein PilC